MEEGQKVGSWPLIGGMTSVSQGRPKGSEWIEGKQEDIRFDRRLSLLYQQTQLTSY